MSFRIRLDSMLKLIQNYINPIRFAVYLLRLILARLLMSCGLWRLTLEAQPGSSIWTCRSSF
jgi:hypothetical protein